MPLGIPQPRPEDAVQNDQNWTWSRPVTRYHPDGSTYPTTALVCEDCWEPVPAYIDAPSGYVSPESNAKLRPGTAEGYYAVAAPEKVVCFECYKAAVARTHVAGTVVPERLGYLA
jgi:hypothetical protein